MSWSKNTAISAGASLFTALFIHCIDASPGEGESEAEPQVSKGITLPVWGPGEMQGNIDVRIWPDDMVLWLERENLRQMIKDPEVPLEDRQNLKQILARQLGWNRRWIGE
ncbi:MAG: hypothetical protein P1V20_19785 [Verrucomicrobiales bacterium]|nr:hypothetical protein [Verrucomicrobiales bacterium]